MSTSTLQDHSAMDSPGGWRPLTFDVRWAAWRAEVRYELLSLLRQLDFALPTLLFPAFFYLLFGVFFGGQSGLSVYLVPTYGAFGVIGTALYGFGVGLAVARETGEMRLKQVTPLSPWAMLGAKMVCALWFSCLVLLELFVLAATLGGVRLERAEWWGLTVVLLLGSLPFAAIGLAIGSHVSGQGAPAVVNLVYLPTAFLSGLWIPVEMLPDFLHKVALFMPPFHLGQLALGVIGQGAGHPPILHLAVLVGITVASLAVAVRGLKR